MNNLPHYYLWYPTLEKDGTGASIILTRGDYSRAPVAGRPFFETLLNLASITGQLIAWRVNPFISAYFSKGDWQESWEAKLILSDAKKAARPAIAGVGISAEAEEEDQPSRYLPVRVFADFTQRRAAEDCRTELKERAAEAEWNEVHYEGYSVRNVGPQHKQLVVNVSTGERSNLAHIIEAAGTVISICENHGARTQAW
jgi:hypothetical protein